MNAFGGNADIAAGRLDLLAHGGRAADEDVVDTGRRDQRAQQHPHLLGIEPAMQDRNVLLFARDHMEDREPLHEAVLQLFQRLAKQHAAGGAIAVEQEKPAVRLARQHALDDRKDRRDAGARGEADMDPRLIRCMGDTEAAGRGHDVELVAGFQLVGGPARERAAIDLLHRDAHLAVIGTGADRIGAAHFLAVHGGAQGQILAGREAVVVREFVGNCKGQRHRIGRLAAQIADRQTMKARGQGRHVQ